MSEVALDQSALPDTDVDVNAPINAPANTVNTDTEANVTGNNAVAIEREKSTIERFFEQPAVRRAAALSARSRPACQHQLLRQ